jgi:hypothetical protein
VADCDIRLLFNILIVVGERNLECGAQDGGYPSAGILGILDNNARIKQKRIPTAIWAISGRGGTTEAAV